MTSKKPLERHFSAGGTVYKKTAKQTLWLIIQPKGTKRWQLPKGTIEKNESSKETAIRETQEEGGITVKPKEKVGKQTYFFQLNGKKIFKTVTFFLMEYLSNTKEGVDKKEITKAEFVPYQKAYELLTFDNDKEILQKAKEILEV